MRDEYSKTERLSMLREIALNNQEELNNAMGERNTKKVFKFIELNDCIDKIIKDIEERG